MATRHKHSVSLSKSQSPITTKWLHDNYEMSDGVSLPRSSLYSHYLDYCQKHHIDPVNAASFGKIIRTTFPSLKTRRLGTRGQSKYHYYGISVRKSSPYFESSTASSRQNEACSSQTHCQGEAVEKRESARPATQVNAALSVSNVMLLPSFPSADSVAISDSNIKEKVKTFLIMYRAHCQRILDTILRANFSEVQNFLVHFWHGIPGHIREIFECAAVVDLVASCDNILYKTIGVVLIPGIFQPIPVSLTQAIRHFAKQLCIWLETALYNLPQCLRNKKVFVGKSFSQLLCRQTSLAHLAQAARTVLHSPESVQQMARDLSEIDIELLVRQPLLLCSANPERDLFLVEKFFCEFCNLLEQHVTIEQYTEWVSNLVARCILKPSERACDGDFQSLAQEFLLKWAFVTSKLVQELTLKSAKSFGSFHLLRMLFDDYLFYSIESYAVVTEDTESLQDIRATQSLRDILSTKITPPSSPSSGRGSLTPSPPSADSSTYLSFPKPPECNSDANKKDFTFGFPFEFANSSRQQLSPEFTNTTQHCYDYQQNFYQGDYYAMQLQESARHIMENPGVADLYQGSFTRGNGAFLSMPVCDLGNNFRVESPYFPVTYLPLAFAACVSIIFH